MLASMKRVQLDSPHGRSATEVLAALNVSFSSGLSDHEAEQRLSVYGANAIGSRQKVGLIAVLVHQFQSLVVALLAVAAAVAFYFREWEEGGAIVGVLILNTAIGFVTEIRAVRSIEAIRALGSRSARVHRGGQTRLIPAERLVPGDIVLLDAGDVISADMPHNMQASLFLHEITN
jgi:Ca2+-transporting ATPase